MPPLAAVPNLDHELDELYALPLEGFTKARNDLATRLRKAHQAEAAEAVRALRKPTLAVWAANRLARGRPDLVAELVEAGGRLRTVQQRALAGREPQAEVTAASAREREAVRALVTAARRELGDRATPQLLDRLSQTLRAAAVDPEASAVLAAGRLAEELRPVGFGPLEAVAPRRRPQSSASHAAERERLKKLRAEARRVAGEARRAAGAADEAELQARRLRSEADELARQAERAATALSAAETPSPDR
ncbi:MAG TPA: hypothetical protein VFU56_00255 [Gaiellaceae bacterium]|nr:hypothetical protein [Gaiellaceae bacterium]